MAGSGVGVTSMQLREHRRSLAVSYTGAIVLSALELLYPLAISLAVSGLLDGSWAGVAVLVGFSLADAALRFAKRWYSTRSFSHLYAKIATDLVERQRKAGVGTTAVAARAKLASELIEFLAHDVETAIAVAFAVIGSLAMLVLLDPLLAVAAGAVAIPTALINVRQARRSQSIYQGLHDEAELEVRLIEAGSRDDVRHHFTVMARQWSQLASAESYSAGLMDLIMMGLALVAVVRATDTGTDVGAIFATLAYVWSYVDGLERVPAIVTRVSHLGDIRRRLDGVGEPGRSAAAVGEG